MARRLTALVCLAGLLSLAPAADAALPGGRTIAVATTVDPDVHLFAESLLARTRVILDPEAFDPDRIVLETRFPPYEQVGPVEQRRREVGGAVELTFTATLRCLEVECLAPRYRTVLGEQEGGRAERYTFRFPPASVLYRHPEGRTELVLQQPFPAVEVVSRINTAQLSAVDEGFGDPAASSVYTASVEPPAPTYRISPRALATAALALAAVLLVLPVTLAGRFVVSRWRAARRPRDLSPVERALLLVELSGRQDDGEQDRRRALEALADVLDRSGVEQLAETTRSTAWAELAPDRTRTRELAADAQAALGGGDGRAR